MGKRMIVLTIKNAPSTVHHYLSKWFFEISTGVYVGQVSARIRDKIWDNLCVRLQSSQLTMIYPDRNEQHLTFRVHNCERQVVDFDGLKLIRRPYHNHCLKDQPSQDDFIQELNTHPDETDISENVEPKEEEIKKLPNQYIILDVETTGLDPNKDKIIEIGLLNVESGIVKNSYSSLITIDKPLSSSITNLTGITDQDLKARGKSIQEVIPKIQSLIKDKPIIGHNVPFDIAFLEKEGLTVQQNELIDTLRLLKSSKKGLISYKLHDLAKLYKFPQQNKHRALSDCFLTYKLFEKIKKDTAQQS